MLTKTHSPLEPTTAPAAYRGHILELDAIRAIGIFIVLVNHSWPREVSDVIFRFGEMGWIAMDAFFVLSGFLITGILLDTRSRPDYFRNYYTRRSLRISSLRQSS
jgi:peptidoglycan/LPS O-acetylase OafA/YrhL